MPGIWSGDATNTYQHYVECPRTEGPKLTPVGGASAVAVAIKAAIRAAIEGHVYGYSGATPLYTLTLSSVAYAPGRITITSSTGNQLVYAVTEVRRPKRQQQQRQCRQGRCRGLSSADRHASRRGQRHQQSLHPGQRGCGRGGSSARALSCSRPAASQA